MLKSQKDKRVLSSPSSARCPAVVAVASRKTCVGPWSILTSLLAQNFWFITQKKILGPMLLKRKKARQKKRLCLRREEGAGPQGESPRPTAAAPTPQRHRPAQGRPATRPAGQAANQHNGRDETHGPAPHQARRTAGERAEPRAPQPTTARAQARTAAAAATRRRNQQTARTAERDEPTRKHLRPDPALSARRRRKTRRRAFWNPNWREWFKRQPSRTNFGSASRNSEAVGRVMLPQ